MKIINYNYGYIPTFSCSIHGKIVVSGREWEANKRYLRNGSLRKTPYLYPDILRKDFERAVKSRISRYVNFYNIRVTATELVVNHWNLRKYKRGNYMFEVREHELKIVSVFDAQAVCVCGWSIACTGERKKAELRAEYRKHLVRARRGGK